MKRRLVKIARYAAVVLVVLALAAAVFAVRSVRRPWPRVDGEVTVPGLDAPVEVVRDRWGVPHLWAETEHDLLFAQGYVHAQDRLWQMEFNRLVASGRLASLLGAPLVETDRYLRTLGLRRAAEADWDRAGAGTRRMLEAYAAGVNHFLETHADRLPLELTILSHRPDPWTPVDSLAWGKLMAFNLSLNHQYEILRGRLAAAVGAEGVEQLFPPYPEDGPVIVTTPDPVVAPAADGEAAAAGRLLERVLASVPGGAGVAWGSNSWVVHGSRTASGRPILANDTHLGLQMPSTWYENGLHGAGLDVVGFSFPGLPLVVIGQNRRIAWGITNMCSDVQDLYLERLDDPDVPRRYRHGEEWRELERIPETLEVKGGEPVTFEVLATHRGPLIHEVVDHLDEPTSLAWTALGSGSRLLDALDALDRAGDWASFRAALADWEAPSVNFTYAGADGDIGYQGTGRVPVRTPGDEGLAPKPGWTGELDWRGFIPFDELPRAHDPPAGYIVTANNRTAGDDYPHHIARDMADPYRAARIHQVLDRSLADGERVDLADVRALQADVLSIPARALAERLAAVEPEGERQARALELLRSWDGRATADSPAAGLYQVWFYFLWPALYEDELGEELAADYRQLGISQVPVLLELMERPDSPWFDDRRTPETEDRDAILRRALDDALDWLAEHAGEEPAAWRWGALHTMTFAHAPFGSSGIGPVERLFNSDTVPVGGDVFTVNEGMPDLARPFRMIFGPSQRFIADLSDPGRSLAVNSTGQSGHLFHRHREDQVPLWAEVDYRPVLPDRAAVDEHAEGTLRLVPPPPTGRPGA